MSTVMDMTQGKSLNTIIKFTIPLLIGSVFQQLYNMVDSAVVGNFVGANALAAVGVCGSSGFLMIAICSGMSSGAGIIIAQLFGGKKEDGIRQTILNATYLLVGIALLICVTGFSLAEGILRLLDTPENIIGDATIYLRTICIGTIAVLIYNEVAAVLRALGDSKTPLYFLILSSLINVVLDLTFVVGLSMGVFGVALATILSQYTSAIVSVIYALKKVPYFHFESSHFTVRTDIMWKIFRVGAPLSFQSSLIAISMMILQGVVNSFGSTVVAAYSVEGRIGQLVSQPFMALGIALSNFTGQNIGARRLDRIKDGFIKSIWTVLIYSLTLIPLIYLFGEDIVGIFVQDPEVITTGAKALRITCLFYFPLGMIYIPRGLLNGSGDTTFSMMNGVTEVGSRIVYSQCLVRIPALGCWSIWLTSGATWLTTAIVCILRYRSGKWKEKALVEEASLCSDVECGA